MKKQWVEKSKKVIGKIIGNYSENIVYEDSFTPVTIERYTSTGHRGGLRQSGKNKGRENKL